MKIYKVKTYNRIMENKWREDCSKHEYNTQADLYTTPFIGMYLYYNEDGEPRKRGWVVEKERGSQFFLKRKDLEAFINEVPNREFDVVMI